MQKNDADTGLDLFQPYHHAILFAFAFSFTLSGDYTSKEHKELIQTFFDEEDGKIEFRILSSVFDYDIRNGWQFERECQMFLKCVNKISRDLNIGIGFGLGESDEGEEFFHVTQV